MARKHGKNGYVTVGSTEVSDRVSFSIDISAQTHDVSTQGNDWTDVDPGQLSASVNIEVFYDPADSGQNLIQVGTTVNLILYPSSTASGNEMITGDFLVESVSLPSAVGDVIKRSYSCKNQGTVTTTPTT